RIAGMNAVLAGGRDGFTAAAPDADAELLECCLVGKQQLEPGRSELVLRVLRERHARLPHLPEPLRPKPGQVDEARERQQRLVRRDVRRRLLAADVLLAGLEREHEAALAAGVRRLADDA